MHAGACTVEAGVGEAVTQRRAIGVADDVVSMIVPVVSSVVVLVADVDVTEDVDAGEIADVDFAFVAGVVIAGNAIRSTLGALPWWFVADRGRLYVLV